MTRRRGKAAAIALAVAMTYACSEDLPHGGPAPPDVTDLKQAVAAGTSVPVTFTFRTAGAVTVQALVQPADAPRPDPSVRCAVSDAVTPAPSAS